MLKKITIIAGLLILGGAAAAWAVSEMGDNYTWHYKMTVEVETPEGVVTGSAVREMGNGEASPLSQSGNPADVRGEAVVVDLGKRGVLFALISHKSDLEFYNAYKKHWPRGGSTPEGIKFYANMPIGTSGVLNPKNPPGYPKLVTFADIDDPKSVTEAQIWTRDDKGYFYLAEDKMEKLFGKGVKLKNIKLEITDELVTWGMVDKHLPESFWNTFRVWMKSMNIRDRGQYVDLFTFKYGEPK